MKKQIVAILVAIAVIASLLTVSVLSEEAYKPIIQSVTVSPTEIVNGGEVTLTIIAKSNAPVAFYYGLCYHFNNESGWKCQSGPRRFTNIGDDLWKCEMTITISEWAPVGTYTFHPISVENEGKLTSDEWPYLLSFNVTRTPVPTPTPPEEEGFGGYRVTPCDAIDISLENVTVTDFLNATNMTTVQVYNFKGYKGENCWMVQWSSPDYRLLNIYVNVATGNIVGVEEQAYGTPSPTPTWHSVVTFSGNSDNKIGSEDKKTQPFTIKGDEWRIRYTVDSFSDFSMFHAYVYPTGDMRDYVSSLECVYKSCSDVQYIYEGNGDYYIEIRYDGNNWKLEVEDYY
jgi:hypothetical protein